MTNLSSGPRAEMADKSVNRVEDGSSTNVEDAGRHQLVGWQRLLVRSIAVCFSLFHLYSAYFLLVPMYQRVIHVCFGFVLIFLLYPWRKKAAGTRLTFDGILLAAITIAGSVYVLANYLDTIYDVGTAPPTSQLLLGGAMIVLSLEAARRVMGWPFVLITITALLFARFGESLPTLIAHRNYDVERLITGMFMTTNGIYGLLTGISATYIFLFVLFGAFLNASGAGDFFLRLASSVFGHVRGGPAKIGVVASSFFGMVSGSGLANAASTGQLTIPLMIRTGYRRHFAAAVEAVSSEAGIVVPPVMGGTAFVMMEIIGVSYVEIMKSAILISVLYYFALFTIVDLEAVKFKLKGMARSELPTVRSVIIEGGHFLIPPILLVYMLVVEHVSPARAAFWATLAIPAVSWLRPSRGMGLYSIAGALEKGAYTALILIGVLVCANIVVGVVNLTGVGLLLSDILIQLAGGNKFLLLILAMVAAIVLGMGLPMAAAYVVLAVLIAPALINVGLDPLASHLFLFYFAMVSQITPPVAPTAFVTASIAGAPHFKTAFTACRLAIVIIVLPYILVFSEHLMFRGPVSEIVAGVAVNAVGVYFLAVFVQGYMVRKLHIYEKLLALLTAVACLVPDYRIMMAGLAGAGVLVVLQRPPMLKSTARLVTSEANKSQHKRSE